MAQYLSKSVLSMEVPARPGIRRSAAPRPALTFRATQLVERSQAVVLLCAAMPSRREHCWSRSWGRPCRVAETTARLIRVGVGRGWMDSAEFTTHV